MHDITPPKPGPKYTIETSQWNHYKILNLEQDVIYVIENASVARRNLPRNYLYIFLGPHIDVIYIHT
jgi:uncharacterized membrane protein